MEKQFSGLRLLGHTIGKEQLAHSKVGVGVTQANLGHGWPKFSPMDGLLGLSIPYLDQIELASAQY